MKTKSIFAAIAMMASSVFADVSYLYWMIDLQGESAEEYQFAYATVSANGSLLVNNNESNGDVGSYIANTSYADGDQSLGTETSAYYAYDVSSYLGSTFLFELFDDEGNYVAYHRVAGSDLKNYIGSAMGQISSPYMVTNVIPEPTCGLLVLFGLAGLALRRKRA